MTTGLAYSSGTAFRAALRDRFKTVVMTDPRYTFNELQRHFAYDRALARCFSGPDAHRWVLKGAGALLARLEQARHSKDVDLYYAERAAAVDEAESALLRALDQDIGDHSSLNVCGRSPSRGGEGPQGACPCSARRKGLCGLPHRRRRGNDDER